jgi:hypothetical protein
LIWIPRRVTFQIYAGWKTRGKGIGRGELIEFDGEEFVANWAIFDTVRERAATVAINSRSFKASFPKDFVRLSKQSIQNE